MNTIKFSHNWNGKLNCQCFTTFRRWNTELYEVDRVYEIELQGVLMGKARMIEATKMPLKLVDPYQAYLDTGYSLPEFIKIVEKMYPGYTGDFGLYLLKYEERYTLGSAGEQPRPRPTDEKAVKNRVSVEGATMQMDFSAVEIAPLHTAYPTKLNPKKNVILIS